MYQETKDIMSLKTTVLTLTSTSLIYTFSTQVIQAHDEHMFTMSPVTKS